ncbi:hypothetical protein BN873_190026 [Candidatus Competibacter denitrificans Run_A_D11]|uniref:Uncharacterized protein n=1 Tax=Candidatus Competibacter denitrificans Run_A_D11 TaxID=1400863 RepID=W6M2C9_9GAMM|nr:hypothetical protein BN873_190026 [Candidatus Competibacter denitrificans Run_A_D11]
MHLVETELRNLDSLEIEFFINVLCLAASHG